MSDLKWNFDELGLMPNIWNKLFYAVASSDNINIFKIAWKDGQFELSESL